MCGLLFLPIAHISGWAHLLMIQWVAFVPCSPLTAVKVGGKQRQEISLPCWFSLCDPEAWGSSRMAEAGHRQDQRPTLPECVIKETYLFPCSTWVSLSHKKWSKEPIQKASKTEAWIIQCGLELIQSALYLSNLTHLAFNSSSID